MTGPLVDRSSTSILNTAVGQETSQGDLWSRATGTLEPTIGLEPMTCRLRIVQADGRRRNPNRLHSRSSTLHPVYPAENDFCFSYTSRPASRLARQLIATRLTQRNKREVKGSDVPAVNQLKPEHVCGNLRSQD